MAAEGALLVSPNLGSCAIDSTFTAQVEHRNVKEVRKLMMMCAASILPPGLLAAVVALLISCLLLLYQTVLALQAEDVCQTMITSTFSR